MALPGAWSSANRLSSSQTARPWRFRKHGSRLSQGRDLTPEVNYPGSGGLTSGVRSPPPSSFSNQVASVGRRLPPRDALAGSFVSTSGRPMKRRGLEALFAPRAAAGCACYAEVMSIKRITISVPESVAARIKKASGSTAVSAWVTHVIEERLEDAELERAWREYLRDVNPSRGESRRADAMFKRLTKPVRKRGAA